MLEDQEIAILHSIFFRLNNRGRAELVSRAAEMTEMAKFTCRESKQENKENTIIIDFTKAQDTAAAATRKATGADLLRIHQGGPGGY